MTGANTKKEDVILIETNRIFSNVFNRIQHKLVLTFGFDKIAPAFLKLSNKLFRRFLFSYRLN